MADEGIRNIEHSGEVGSGSSLASSSDLVSEEWDTLGKNPGEFTLTLRFGDGISLTKVTTDVSLAAGGLEPYRTKDALEVRRVIQYERNEIATFTRRSTGHGDDMTSSITQDIHKLDQVAPQYREEANMDRLTTLATVDFSQAEEGLSRNGLEKRYIFPDGTEVKTQRVSARRVHMEEYDLENQLYRAYFEDGTIIEHPSLPSDVRFNAEFHSLKDMDRKKYSRIVLHPGSNFDTVITKDHNMPLAMQSAAAPLLHGDAYIEGDNEHSRARASELLFIDPRQEVIDVSDDHTEDSWIYEVTEYANGIKVLRRKQRIEPTESEYVEELIATGGAERVTENTTGGTVERLRIVVPGKESIEPRLQISVPPTSQAETRDKGKIEKFEGFSEMYHAKKEDERKRNKTNKKLYSTELTQQETAKKMRLDRLFRRDFAQFRRRSPHYFSGDSATGWMGADYVDQLGGKLNAMVLRDNSRAHYTLLLGFDNQGKAITIDSLPDVHYGTGMHSCQISLIDLEFGDSTTGMKFREEHLERLPYEVRQVLSAHAESTGNSELNMLNILASRSILQTQPSMGGRREHERMLHDLGLTPLNGLPPVSRAEVSLIDRIIAGTKEFAARVAALRGKKDRTRGTIALAEPEKNRMRDGYNKMLYGSDRVSFSRTGIPSDLYRLLPANLAVIPGQSNGSDCSLFSLMLAHIITINNAEISITSRLEAYNNLGIFLGQDTITLLEETDNLFSAEIKAYKAKLARGGGRIKNMRLR